MRPVRVGIIAVVVVLNLSLFVFAGSWTGFKEFINPTSPLSESDILVNGNQTGKDIDGYSYVRSVSGDKVHSTFQKYTNSCASCHMTHTAGGEQILFQNTGYNTCMSCHDGSVPHATNVLAGIMPVSGALASGGKFNENLQPDASVSYHLSTGVKKHGDAPGVQFRAEDSSARYTRRGHRVEGDWDKPFTCASCHGIHGSYSKRHLHYNPNGIIRRSARETVTMKYMSDGVYVIDAVYQEEYLPWYYVDRDINPELALVATANGVDVTDQVTFNHAQGKILSLSREPFTGTVSVSYYKPLTVKMDILNHYSTEQAEKVIYQGGIVDFCSSCHIGHYDKNGIEEFNWHNENRLYHLLNVNVMNVNGSALLNEAQAISLALEERDGGKFITCLTCHFAHGTDRNRMLKRGADWGLLGQLLPLNGADSPENTKNLRFYNGGNGKDPVTGFDYGRYEVCYLCHGHFRYNPEVVNTSPTANSTVAAGNLQSVIIRLRDKDMILDSTTVNTITVTVFDGETPVSGTVTYNEQMGEISFTSLEWKAGRQYTVTLSGGIKSRIGGSMQEYSFKFYTYLEVSSTNPLPGVTDVPQDSNIAATMTAAVSGDTVTSNTFSVSYIENSSEVFVTGNRSVSGSGNNIITFTMPDGQRLPSNTVITVRLKGGLGGVRAVSGATVADPDYHWTFTTVP